MRTATFDVGGMLSMLDYQGIEKQIGRMAGVRRVTASIASGSATVEYDEAVTNAEALKAKINECGFHCAGEVLPAHICEPRHIAHALQPERPARTAPTMPMTHDMAHEMGHGAGMDMQAMVRDMRNRFWISLIFSIPIFIYSPMGMGLPPLIPPFGMDLNLFLFILASAAILYPVWPFVVAACWCF
jgi:Cu2+-exporting ATPase